REAAAERELGSFLHVFLLGCAVSGAGATLAAACRDTILPEVRNCPEMYRPPLASSFGRVHGADDALVGA
ncbi:MAG TPA: hypothetical protein VGB79_00750, partial [Allosphingosinicella sp.]